MRKLITILVVGYLVVWLYEYAKKSLGENNVSSVEDLKRMIREKLD
jgi:hypothetical protein